MHQTIPQAKIFSVCPMLRPIPLMAHCICGKSPVPFLAPDAYNFQDTQSMEIEVLEKDNERTVKVSGEEES